MKRAEDMEYIREYIDATDDGTWECDDDLAEQERERYIQFMNNADNAYNCAECPENQGFEAFPEMRKPCGQFNCWVKCHCRNDEDY